MSYDVYVAKEAGHWDLEDLVKEEEINKKKEHKKESEKKDKEMMIAVIVGIVFGIVGFLVILFII